MPTSAAMNVAARQVERAQVDCAQVERAHAERTHAGAANAATAHPTRHIGGVALQAVTRDAAIATMTRAIATGGAGIFAFCNMHTANQARVVPEFAAALAQMTVFNDGIGIDLASRLLFGAPFPDNLNGTDLTPALLAALPPTRVFLLGSPPGVAEQAAAILQARHPHLCVVGTADGFFAATEAGAVAGRIRACGAQLVLVGMGHPRQETWAAEWGGSTGAVILCVGAFLDFTAGVVTRAPGFVRAARCEWLFRFVQEPRRLFRRYFLGAPGFFLAIARQRLRRASHPPQTLAPPSPARSAS